MENETEPEVLRKTEPNWTKLNRTGFIKKNNPIETGTEANKFQKQSRT